MLSSINHNISNTNTPILPHNTLQAVNIPPNQSLGVQNLQTKSTPEDQLSQIASITQNIDQQGLSDQEEFALAEQLQSNINLLKQQINDYELRKKATMPQAEQIQTTNLVKSITQLSQRTKFQSQLSFLGKIITCLMVLWPLPGYLQVVCQGKKMSKIEKNREIEKESWRLLLLNIVCNSVWISYSFKIQSIEMAIVNVVAMLIHIILTSIYLNVKPEQNLILQFFGLILTCQLFNFDFFNQYSTGAFAIGFGVLQSMVPLSIIPSIIETRNTQELNIYKLYIGTVNSVTWIMWCYESSHYLYMIYFVIALTSQIVQIQFYQWANDQQFSSHNYNGETLYLGSSHISHSDSSYTLVNMLIPFFKQFIVSKKFNEMQNMFYVSQNSQKTAIMNQYTKYRMTQQKERYEDDLFDEEPQALDQEEYNDWSGQAEDIEAIASQNIQMKNKEAESISEDQNPYLSEMKSKPALNEDQSKPINHYYREPEEEYQTQLNGLNSQNLSTLPSNNNFERQKITLQPRLSASSFGSSMTFKSQNSYVTATSKNSFRTAESYGDATDQQLPETHLQEIPSKKQEMEDLKAKLEIIQENRQKTD